MELCSDCTDSDWESALLNLVKKPRWFTQSDSSWQEARKPVGIYIEIYADGDLQGVTSSSEGAEEIKSASTGSLGILLETPRSFYTMSISVALCAYNDETLCPR
jgi:hypothetical protein